MVDFFSDQYLGFLVCFLFFGRREGGGEEEADEFRFTIPSFSVPHFKKPENQKHVHKFVQFILVAKLPEMMLSYL